MTAIANPREWQSQLNAIKGQLAQLRLEETRHRQAAAQARQQMVEPGASPEVGRRLAQAVNTQAELHAQIEELAERRRALLHQASPGGGAVNLSAPLAEQLADPTFTGELARLANSRTRIGDMVLGEVPREEVIAWSGGALGGLGGIRADTTTYPVDASLGMTGAPLQRTIPLLQPQPRFLDLVPSMGMEWPSFPYAQEVAVPQPQGGGPAPTVPLALKPEVEFQFQDAIANPVTIAGFTKMARQAIMDVPMLASVLQNRLMFKTRQALEAQVLSGTGEVSDRTGQPGIIGLLNTPGVATISVESGENDIDAVLDAVTNAMIAGANPNAIALNPLDWAAMLKEKSAGSGEYFGGSPFLETARTAWGVTLTPAVGVPQGTVIVVDTTIALTLLIRESALIRLSDMDQDDMLRNRLTALCEVRAGLAVWIPAAVCICQLTSGS